MPRNRRPQDRDEKRDEIVRAAELLFTRDGFAETPLSKVASAAGVTTNTIYWYFADKDALLVGVLDRVLHEALAEAAALPDRPWDEQLLWALARLQRYHRLVTVVHARANSSKVIDSWHTGFHDLADAMLVEGFREAGAAEDDLLLRAQLAVFVIEGLLMHPHDESAARSMLRLLVPTAS
ncbi:TetR/AcrR family transcriptional regulator [Aeromicrobium sp.]|uniref:TetR/AcrR family transcriptional regulator n=1 Tax=Aeromicrobium sp. TaxID=1871063 RepID=UPI0030C1F5EC